ncbi:hypothetical protein M1D80_16100 [Phyllobacteriaceae bacterium JZ32]
MAAEARRELVDFVVERAFDPVMKAKPDGRSESERRKLKDVQEATRAEIERFRDYGSAREVLVNFRRDLDSDPAKKIHAELKALDLPTINDIRDEFEEKARKLGVEAD